MSGIIHSDNKHAASAREALSYLKELGDSKWDFKLEKDKVKISTKKVPGSSIPMIRGDTVLGAGWTLEQIGAIILSPGARNIWDNRFQSSVIKERYTPYEALFHYKMRGTLFTSDRDIVSTSIAEYHEGKEFIVAMISVPDPSIPLNPLYVRANLDISGWILKPLGGGSISISYIVHLNLNGSIPSFIMKKILYEMPLCAGKVCDYARRFGFPPYAKKVEGRIVREEFDHRRKMYAIEVDASEEHGFFGDKNGSIVLEASGKMFPNGLGVQTNLPENIQEKEEVNKNILVTIKHIKAPVIITLSKS